MPQHLVIVEKVSPKHFGTLLKTVTKIKAISTQSNSKKSASAVGAPV